MVSKKVTDCGKHVSLHRYGVNYALKMFNGYYALS